MKILFERRIFPSLKGLRRESPGEFWIKFCTDDDLCERSRYRLPGDELFSVQCCRLGRMTGFFAVQGRFFQNHMDIAGMNVLLYYSAPYYSKEFPHLGGCLRFYEDLNPVSSRCSGISKAQTYACYGPSAILPAVNNHGHILLLFHFILPAA